MDHLLWSLVPWGYRVLLSLETVRSAPLTLFLSIITDLGSDFGYLVILSLIYWCVDKRAGQALAYCSLISAALNLWLKYVWSIPRPRDVALEGVLQDAGIARRVTPLREATQPSFPSGHAQGAAATWGYIAHYVRADRVRSGSAPRKWVWPVVVILVALIAFSRMYFGVHFPQDVIGGLAIGAAYLAAWLWIEPRIGSWLPKLPVQGRYALAVLVPLALAAVRPDEDTTAAMGAMFGLGVGYVLEGQTLCFTATGRWRQKALRGLLGLVLTISTYLALRALFGLIHIEGLAGLVLRMFRYALVGFAGAWVAPWVFLRAGLARGTA